MKRRLVIYLQAAIISGFMTVANHNVQAQDAARRIQVNAKRFTFEPSEISVKKGEPVVLVLTSGDVDHGLKFKELGVAVSVKKGQTGELKFTPDKAGTFVGQCSVFCGSGHGSMKLTLHVTE